MNRMTRPELKKAREALGLSLADAAGLIGASTFTIHNWESGGSGKQPISQSTILNYIKALDAYAKEQTGKLAKLDLRPEALCPDLFTAVAA